MIILSLSKFLDMAELWRMQSTSIQSFDPSWYERSGTGRLMSLWRVLRLLPADTVVVFHRNMTLLAALSGSARSLGVFRCHLLLEDFFIDNTNSGREALPLRVARRWARWAVYRLVAATVDVIGVHSRWEEKVLPQRFGQPAGKFRFHPVWIDEKHMARYGPSDVPSPPDRDFILVAGTLRDYRCFLRAILGTNLRATVIVYPWDRGSIDVTLLTTNVRVLGDISWTEYIGYLHACMFVVVPLHVGRPPRSLGHSQALEAMMCGKAVICADTFHVADYMREGAALLYRSEDPGDLREQILRLSRDAALRESLAAEARRLVTTEYTLNRYLLRLIETCRAVAAEGG